jgi:hypothetical protein
MIDALKDIAGIFYEILCIIYYKIIGDPRGDPNQYDLFGADANIESKAYYGRIKYK